MNCGKCIRCMDEGWKPGDPADNGIAAIVKPSRRRMVVCVACGCKRCPHATDHNFACTESNAPGQPGSVYA